MSNITSLLENNTEHYDLFITAGKVAKEQNLSCYLVGGYVRDILLNRQSTDIDIMVEGDALSYAKILGKKIGVPKIVQFEEFGTARIPYDKFEIEVSSARSESYTKNSRNPKIKFSTFKYDMSRRDFTVNAIASSIHPDSFGELHDPFSGIKDLHKGLIITPLDPDTTFDDDPLRMLRAIRFSAQLGFDIAPNLLDSISRMKERMKIISWERITQELIKILSTKQPSIGF